MNNLKLQALGRELAEADEAYRHPLTGKVANAFNGYLAPFHASASWIEDARGNNVCEAYSREVAESICDLLNKTYPAPKPK